LRSPWSASRTRTRSLSGLKPKSQMGAFILTTTGFFMAAGNVLYLVGSGLKSLIGRLKDDGGDDQ